MDHQQQHISNRQRPDEQDLLRAFFKFVWPIAIIEINWLAAVDMFHLPQGIPLFGVMVASVLIAIVQLCKNAWEA